MIISNGENAMASNGDNGHDRSGIDFMKNSKWGVLWSNCSPQSIVIDFRDDHFFMPQEPFRELPIKVISVEDRDPVFVLTVQLQGAQSPQPQQKITIFKHTENEVAVMFPRGNANLQRCAGELKSFLEFDVV